MKQDKFDSTAKVVIETIDIEEKDLFDCDLSELCDRLMKIKQKYSDAIKVSLSQEWDGYEDNRFEIAISRYETEEEIAIRKEEFEEEMEKKRERERILKNRNVIELEIKQMEEKLKNKRAELAQNTVKY